MAYRHFDDNSLTAVIDVVGAEAAPIADVGHSLTKTSALRPSSAGAGWSPLRQICCHHFASDATNSTVWRNSKLQTTFCENLYIAHPSTTNAERLLSSENVYKSSSYCDLQVVKNGTAVVYCKAPPPKPLN
eukprot:12420957-Karenia_brevis.AAC.1